MSVFLCAARAVRKRATRRGRGVGKIESQGERKTTHKQKIASTSCSSQMTRYYLWKKALLCVAFRGSVYMCQCIDWPRYFNAKIKDNASWSTCHLDCFGFGSGNCWDSCNCLISWGTCHVSHSAISWICVKCIYNCFENTNKWFQGWKAQYRVHSPWRALGTSLNHLEPHTSLASF